MLSSLPNELLIEIGTFLDADALAQASCCCHQLRRLFGCDDLWKCLYQSRGWRETPQSIGVCDWKQAFNARMRYWRFADNGTAILSKDRRTAIVSPSTLIRLEPDLAVSRISF